MNIFRLHTLRVFYREYSTMIKAGVNILESTRILEKYPSGPKFRKTIKLMQSQLTQGKSLSKAMSTAKDIFPKWHRNVIKYSEEAGRLGDGLENIADYLDKEYEMQKNIIIGLAYPVLLLHVALFLFPVPELIKSGAATYWREVWNSFLPFYAVFAFLYFLKRLIDLTTLKDIYDSVILFIPVLGSMNRRINLTKFMRALKCSHESGISIVTAWKTSMQLCDNANVKKSLTRGYSVVQNGGSLLEAFLATRVFSPKLTGMMAAGEKSGSIPEMLNKMAIFSEKETDLVMGMMAKIMPVIIYLMVASFIGYRIVMQFSEYMANVGGGYF